jgi:hypothetical protein
MKSFSHNLLLAALFLCLISQARAQKPAAASVPATKAACIKQPGFIGGPFVPTARAARLISLRLPTSSHLRC